MYDVIEKLVRDRAAAVGTATAIVELDEAVTALYSLLGCETMAQRHDAEMAQAIRDAKEAGYDEGYEQGRGEQ